MKKPVHTSTYDWTEISEQRDCSTLQLIVYYVSRKKLKETKGSFT
jgi:hypothetical protein